MFTYLQDRPAAANETSLNKLSLSKSRFVYRAKLGQFIALQLGKTSCKNKLHTSLGCMFILSQSEVGLNLKIQNFGVIQTMQQDIECLLEVYSIYTCGYAVAAFF